MKYLIEFFKGIAIGVANIIPGFSGGTMAVIFGLYEKLIYAFSHFFERPIKIIKEMWAIAIGVVVGIGLAVFAITILLDHYPVPTILFFVGLIFGSIPKIQERANLLSKEQSPKIGMLLGMFLLLLLTFIPVTDHAQDTMSIIFIIGLFFIGALGSASMVVPGVSGSLIFLIFGYYDYILNLASDFIKGFLSINLDLLSDTILNVLILGVGIIIGVVLIAKLIEKLMLSHKTLIYGFITGLLIASPISILVNLEREYPVEVRDSSFLIWFLGFALVLTGTVISYTLGKKESLPDIETLQEHI
uniref:Membrane protein n=1 Tax=Firmicutes bacterium enrichment culture clone fosmid MGS-M1 TaxID=1549348 RepID=A0A0B5KQF6_9FIRM|nr:membrane protein [Firmicutes bacterium enrichment culture clone fosmid MGS-M1]